jgi:hypothetical protein
MAKQNHSPVSPCEDPGSMPVSCYFPPSVWLHQCSILICIYLLFLLEKWRDAAHRPSRKKMLFRKSGGGAVLDREIPHFKSSHLRPLVDKVALGHNFKDVHKTEKKRRLVTILSPSARNSIPKGRIFVKLHSRVIFEKNLSKKFKLHQNLTITMGTLQESVCTFVTISRWILLRTRKVSDNSSRKKNKNTYFMFKNFFRKSCRLWDNVEKYRGIIHARELCMMDM